MNLSDYQWSHNPRGMHGTGIDYWQWRQWGLGWIKLVYEDEKGINYAGHALELGVTPIVRVHRAVFSGQVMDDAMRRLYQDYLSMGVRWFEFYNEPNLPYEWWEGTDLRPDNLDLIRPLCDNWLTWAEFIINNGGYPGFTALSELATDWGNTTAWLVNLLQYMSDHHYERFRNIINNGMWIATHPYIVNHWYQEEPGGGARSARPAVRVNHQEGGWHFEYPYDPICQADDPGRTVWGGTPSAPINDVVGLLATGIAWLEALQEMFGVGWIPVVGTEGGIWRIPDSNDPIFQPDTRYPAYDINSHAQGTIAMFDWLADQAPPWMFGVTLWEFESYWRNGNPIPALNLLGSTTPRLKQNIPPIPALGEAPRPYDPGFSTQPQVAQQPTPQTESPEITPQSATALPPTTVAALVPGPGPIHGAPALHFVVLGLDQPNWFFESSGLAGYWARFQPVLMPNLDFIDLLSVSDTLAVTLITTPAMVSTLRQEISARWQYVWIDAVVVQDATELNTIFERRVRNGLRFA